MILTLRTDNPDAEVGLYASAGGKQLSYHKWHADRALGKQLLTVIKQELANNGADFTAITAVIAYKGPGSFTGLRIGLTVANTLAYGLEVPIVGAEDKNWVKAGLERLQKGETDRLVLPHYGAEANISTPRK